MRGGKREPKMREETMLLEERECDSVGPPFGATTRSALLAALWPMPQIRARRFGCFYDNIHQSGVTAEALVGLPVLSTRSFGST